MSESKEKESEDCKRTLFPTVEIEKVDISPNPANLTDELNLEIDFSLSASLNDAFWEIKYLVDSVRKRHIIKIFLGRTKVTDYDSGSSSFHFSVPGINVDGIKPCSLTNCGLLIASLKSGDEEVMDLNMVINVSNQDDILQRVIYNPLD